MPALYRRAAAAGKRPDLMRPMRQLHATIGWECTRHCSAAVSSRFCPHHAPTVSQCPSMIGRRGYSMARREPEPGAGSAFMGAAAASFATGPTLILTYGIYTMLTDPAAADMDASELGSLGSFTVFSSFICLIGSIPAAALNAIALNHLVHRGKDAVWWAIMGGGIIGLLVAFIMTGLFARAPDFRFDT